MTPKERKVVFTLIGVMFIIMVSVMIITSSKRAKNNEEATIAQNTEMQNMYDFVQNNVSGNVNNNNESNTVNNGTNTNVNTPSVKTYKTVLISNIEYKKDNIDNKIVADIKNIGTTNFTSEVAKLTLITSSGEQIQSTIIIPSLEAGQTSKLEHLLDENQNNIVDFNIEEI